MLQVVAALETVVVSDLHLTEAQPVDPRRPWWMAYKRREFFVDADFARLLAHVQAHAAGPLELVLNGDTFDFDSVTQLPTQPAGAVDWLARLRGLAAEEWMSLFKLECIIRDHPVWFGAVAAFVRAGHQVVFVLGNHDVELHWPSVQRRIRDALVLPAPPEPSTAAADPVRFCGWFYLSEGDVYLSHGHQYDRNCVDKSPIHPLILVRGRPQVRIPFGDIATRYLLNGMGYFNPHATENYIMSAGRYVTFFLRHVLRTQPLLPWSWLWGAVVTLVVTLRSHWRPAMRDPLLLEQRVDAMARQARTSPAVVRQLHELSVPSAAANPLAVLRELWLDRALLLLAAVYGAWQLVLLVNIALRISPWWALLPLGLFLPAFVAYASSVNPTVFRHPLLSRRRAELLAAITGASIVVFGHTHRPEQCTVGPVRYLNGGFWSPAFREPQCVQRLGTQTFVWIRAEASGGARRAELLEWAPGASEPRPFPAARSDGGCGDGPPSEPLSG